MSLTQLSEQALPDLGTSEAPALEQKGLPVPHSIIPELFLRKLSADRGCKSLGEDRRGKKVKSLLLQMHFNCVLHTREKLEITSCMKVTRHLQTCARQMFLCGRGGLS